MAQSNPITYFGRFGLIYNNGNLISFNYAAEDNTTYVVRTETLQPQTKMFGKWAQNYDDFVAKINASTEFNKGNAYDLDADALARFKQEFLTEGKVVIFPGNTHRYDDWETLQKHYTIEPVIFDSVDEFMAQFNRLK